MRWPFIGHGEDELAYIYLNTEDIYHFVDVVVCMLFFTCIKCLQCSGLLTVF